MTRLALALSRDEASNFEELDEILLWDGESSDSFKSRLQPNLTSLGSVPQINADFVRFAIGVYASDQSVLRAGKGAGWSSRQIELTVPVGNPELWKKFHIELAQIVAFLTGDDWSFVFVKSTQDPVSEPLIKDVSKRVVLVSGGADSASGALLSSSSLKKDELHSFVSHSSSGAGASTPQRAVVDNLGKYFPGKVLAHHQIFLGRTRNRIDGSRFKKENSSRSRSLLFLALGLAIAVQSESDLWIPENGFASLNPPLGPERLGALSTRTTHPWFISRVSEVINKMGGHGFIVNPFQRMTKGEMFKEVVNLLGINQASDYLSTTHSCSHSDQQYVGVPIGTHCGVCFGCIVRRAAFAESAIPDLTRYLSSEGRKFSDYVTKRSIVEAAKDFVEAGISDAAIMAMTLPEGLSAHEAQELCRRGQVEIGNYLI